jgi:integrase/recombinase XerD
MDDLRDLYFKNLRVLGYAPGTIESHEWRLKPFLKFLESKGITDPKAIDAQVVRNYQTHLFEVLNAKGKRNGVSYRNNQLIVAKKFLKFLHEEKVLDEDPGKDVVYALEPKRLPRYVLSGPEVKKLLNAPDKNTVLGYRDKTMMEVLYTNGCRRKELLNLKLTDLELDAALMRINLGKGQKDRVVPIGKVALRYLKYYIDHVRPFLVKQPTDYLFLSLRGTKLSKCMLGLRMKLYADKAGIEKKVTPHTMRATCATHCIRGKTRKEQMHPRHLMELLGHSSLESLNPYLSVSAQELKEAHQRCHPREKMAS